MPRFWFVRHGESVANAEGWLAGHRDVPLTARGEEQARALAPQLRALTPDRVVASDLQRAWRTGALAWNHRLPPVSRIPELRERHVGRWEGVPIGQLAEAGAMSVLTSWEGAPPEGESQEVLSVRVLAWLAANDDQDTLIFAHGGVIRCVVGLLDREPTERIGYGKVGNTEVITRDVAPGTFARLRQGVLQAARRG
ncbi:MAG: histidine phosphatase family protein [Alphaproteobacteria bacterium]|nr:histidine phosphatase family protein [Alphaproteobacteria bacterium]MCB9698063.1 histidine phosphatase family protein [Alphaproteobacteria bacterium]